MEHLDGNLHIMTKRTAVAEERIWAAVNNRKSHVLNPNIQGMLDHMHQEMLEFAAKSDGVHEVFQRLKHQVFNKRKEQELEFEFEQLDTTVG